MTTAQPGQEQRMVTDAMIQAGREAYSEWQQSLDPRTCSLSEAIYTAMHSARPTADLGEDGELEALKHDIRRAQETSSELATENALYREALDRARFWFAGYVANGGKGADEELEALRAVLSRSGR